MRAVVQRCAGASCSVDGSRVGSIRSGLVAFVGIRRDDSEHEVKRLSRKLCGLRVFPDERGRMNRSVRDAGGGVLLIPQFTVYGECGSGYRPSFHEAMQPAAARGLFECLAHEIAVELGQVQTGIFGAFMRVEVTNDGPVTVILDLEPNSKDIS